MVTFPSCWQRVFSPSFQPRWRNRQLVLGDSQKAPPQLNTVSECVRACVRVCVRAEQVQMVISVGKSKRCWAGPDLRLVTRKHPPFRHTHTHTHTHTHYGPSPASEASCHFVTTPFLMVPDGKMVTTAVRVCMCMYLHNMWPDACERLQLLSYNYVCVCVCVCVCMCWAVII